MDIVGIKELINQRFDDTGERIDQQFASMGNRVDRLTEQVTATNGRVQKAEMHIAVLQDRLYLSAGAILFACAAYIVKLFL